MMSDAGVDGYLGNLGNHTDEYSEPTSEAFSLSQPELDVLDVRHKSGELRFLITPFSEEDLAINQVLTTLNVPTLLVDKVGEKTVYSIPYSTQPLRNILASAYRDPISYQPTMSTIGRALRTIHDSMEALPEDSILDSLAYVDESKKFPALLLLPPYRLSKEVGLNEAMDQLKQDLREILPVPENGDASSTVRPLIEAARDGWQRIG